MVVQTPSSKTLYKTQVPDVTGFKFLDANADHETLQERNSFRRRLNFCCQVLIFVVIVIAVVVGGLHLFKRYHMTGLEGLNNPVGPYKQFNVPHHDATRTWTTSIFWNFLTGYQVVKYNNGGQIFCYAYKLENSTISGSPEQNVRIVKNNVFHAVEDTSYLDRDPASIIGPNAYEACKDNKIMWLAISDGESSKNSHHFSESISPNATKNSAPVLARSKRNIRTCRTSCCYRVCCCDVHHFIWETIEEFNCNHVCVRCSKNYHAVIQKLC